MDKISQKTGGSRINWIQIALVFVFLVLANTYRMHRLQDHKPSREPSTRRNLSRSSYLPKPPQTLVPNPTLTAASSMESVVPRIPNMPNPPVLYHEPPELKTPGWQYITVKPGDSLASLFNRAGISSKTLQLILQNNPHAALLTRIKPNQTIQLLLEQHALKQLILPLANAESLVIEHQGSGYTTTHHFDALHSQNRFISATVKNSLYETAKRNNIPFPLIRKMSEIFHSEINFARDVHTGDQFTLLYKTYFNKDKLIRTGEILALSYTTRNKTYQAVRHEINAHDAEYFTPDGRSLKQGFSRYPLEFSRISSLFSLSRMHPILHYSRPHQGIDLAAPTGTPVHATGDGRIEKIQREAGFGNVVKISHQSTYTSIYAHLLRFEKGLRHGSYVKRGQIIGYVGQTGLAEGPHCHYEFHVNHTPRNPLTVNLPLAAPVPTKQLGAFKQKAHQLLGELKHYEIAQMKSGTRKV